MHLYNTLHRRVEAFVPTDPDRVTLYVCGPTVYNYIHIGNARTFLVFDLLARTLKRRFPNVIYARNITDIDDKINAAARQMDAPITAITQRFDAAFRADMAGLGLMQPDSVPYATAHIAQIIAMCERLIASGHAYVGEHHVLFSVASFPDYGKLSRRDPEDMLAGARIDVAPYKRDPGDFVLWKPSDDTLPGWDSPWGRGRPGWHIECSAMAETHLGDTLDIHGGGMDLQFPHHENEVAQSECAHGGRIFARYWMHSGMLNLGGSKMSKSLGNTFHVHDLLRAVPPEALRYALLSGHYRQPLDWSEALIEQSIRTLDRLYGTLRDLDAYEVDTSVHKADVVESALEDDLNTPEALKEVNAIASLARQILSKTPGGPGENDRAELVQAKSELLAAGRALNLLQMKPSEWFARGADSNDDARIQTLIDERNIAKKNRDFARADAIRKQLAGEGIVLEDTPNGTRWKRS